MWRCSTAVCLAGLICGIALAAVNPGRVGAQVAPGTPDSLTRPDCGKLKGKDKSACLAKLKAEDDTARPQPAKGATDPLAFPEASSRKGGEMQHGTGDMPTAGVPDPPSESMKPSDVDSLPGSPAQKPSGSSSSSSGSSFSSSSADSGVPGPAESDEDAAPTTAGSDTPVKASSLKDLGTRGNVSAARTKLEESRIDDDLKVGAFYFKDGNLVGAQARFRDALQRDPDNPDAHFGLAQVLLKQSKRDEAVTHLKRYVQLAPDDNHTREAQKLLAKLQSPK